LNILLLPAVAAQVQVNLPQQMVAEMAEVEVVLADLEQAHLLALHLVLHIQ
jgi:hypothetical protein